MAKKSGNFYMFKKRTDGGTELIAVEGIISRRALIVGSGDSEIRLPFTFDAKSFFLGDLLFAQFDPVTREITPLVIPESPIDPSQDTGLLASVEGQVQHYLDGSKALETVTKEVDAALKAKSLDLMQTIRSKIDDAAKKWVDVAGNIIPTRVQVNFAGASSVHPPWYVPVTLGNGGRSLKVRAMADSGADLQLIEPSAAKKLGAPIVGQTSVITVDGGETVNDVVAVDVTINGGRRIFYAATYPGLHKRVKSDFLLSRGAMEWAADAGLTSFPPK